jgi:CRP-like cAMP-binding protein
MVARSPVTPTELDMERILLLKRVPLFRYLPLDTLLAVGRVLERRHYIDGETILQADARWDHFCLIETGGVDLLAPDSGIEHLVAPAHFGELVLVEEHLRSPKVVAVGDCTLLRLHRIVFHDLSRDHPDMLMELCKLLARRLRRAEEGARS